MRAITRRPWFRSFEHYQAPGVLRTYFLDVKVWKVVSTSREVYVFLEDEFLDKDDKEQQNTVFSHDLPGNQTYVCSCGSNYKIWSSDFYVFRKGCKNFLPYTSLLKVDAPSIH